MKQSGHSDHGQRLPTSLGPCWGVLQTCLYTQQGVQHEGDVPCWSGHRTPETSTLTLSRMQIGTPVPVLQSSTSQSYLHCLSTHPSQRRAFPRGARGTGLTLIYEMPESCWKVAPGLNKCLQSLSETRLYLWVFSAGRVFLSTFNIS